MTQQNDTEQQGAAEPGSPDQPASARPELAGSGQLGMAAQLGMAGQASPPKPQQPAVPAPTLYGYESVPDAYLAPPQPGQPRYGTPVHPGGRGAVGRTGDGERGYGHPPGGQPGYGRPAAARPAVNAARHDPALARPWQRLVAQAIDWFLIIIASEIVFWSQVSLVGRELQAATGRNPELNSPAFRAAANSLRSSTSYQHALLFWFLGMFGIALIYYWVLHATSGATVGKWAMGMRVVRAADHSRIGVLMAGVRALAFLAGPAIFMLLTLLISPFNVVGGVLWAADNSLPLLDVRAQSLHDKLAGTVVVRKRALGDQTRQPSTW